jgi:KaiC/GvpD/RAD55 family RecA-like ATPase
MSRYLTLPILDGVVPGGFPYGSSYLIEFEPDSLWYETSLTIAAQALRHGMKTEYHTFMHLPNDIREALVRLGLNLKRLEEEGIFRIIDTYTRAAGLGLVGEPVVGGISLEIHKPSLLEDLTAEMVRMVKEGVPDSEKGWFHVDDDASVLNRYRKEEEIIDMWRTRIVPYLKVRELVLFHSLLTGVASDSFYRQYETMCDGIIDFKSIEEEEQVEHYFRVRTMRGKKSDSRWQHLLLLNNGEVKLDAGRPKVKELGISSWLKGPRKQ